MSLLILMVLLCISSGCAAQTDEGSITERRLSDFNGTMAYASDSAQDSDQSGATKKLSEFSTKFNKNSTGRAENITRAANAINQTIVYPGELFSFNETVGPTNKQAGYKRSKIFVRGKELMGIGGGVCQVSSTLFNAVKEAGLTVTERHPHSRRVFYVEKNNDAAVSYGGIDFKFENNYEFPIIIKSGVEEDTLTIQVEALFA